MGISRYLLDDWFTAAELDEVHSKPARQDAGGEPSSRETALTAERRP